MDKKKLQHFIKTGLIDLIVILTSVAYVIFNMVKVEKTQLSLIEMITKAGFGIVVGLLIKQCLGENGFNKGYTDIVWIGAIEKYSSACNLANPYMERVDYFYLHEEKEKKKVYRRTNLMGVRLKYIDYFDDEGNYIGSDENWHSLTKHQKRVLKKCIEVKIYPLNLFSEYANEVGADTHKERTDNFQRGKMLGKNSVAAIFTSVVGVYFIPVLSNWDWGAFAVALVQVCIWVTTGIIQLYTNYNYVVVEKVSKLKRKMELIVKFTKGCDNGLYTSDPYEKGKISEEKVTDISSNEHCDAECLPNSEIPVVEEEH